jgi:hypothetical protein
MDFNYILVLYSYLRTGTVLYITPSVSFYLSLDSAILHYPATNKKKRREYLPADKC